MLVFIIPLKSPKVASSWEAVTQLFNRTVRSVCNQTSSNFQVIVVCNEIPNVDFTHPNLTYIERDFAIPGDDYPSKEFDRTRKMVTGILQAQQLAGVSHIMAVDADDLISSHLADFVSKNPQHPGWVISQGYLYREGSQFIKVMRKGFDRYCGTSTIIRNDFYQLPNSSDLENSVSYFYKYCRHREITETLINKGITLTPLPLKGAIYITATGENIYHGPETTKHTVSLKSRLLRLKATLDNRPITRNLRQEFSLYNLA